MAHASTGARPHRCPSLSGLVRFVFSGIGAVGTGLAAARLHAWMETPSAPRAPAAPLPAQSVAAAIGEREQALFRKLFELGARKVMMLELHTWPGNLEAMGAVLEGANDAGVPVRIYREAVDPTRTCEDVERLLAHPLAMISMVDYVFHDGVVGPQTVRTRERLDRLSELIHRNGPLQVVCFDDKRFSLGRALKDRRPSVVNMGYAHGIGRHVGHNRVTVGGCEDDLSAYAETAAYAQLDEDTQKDGYDGAFRLDGEQVVVVMLRSIWGRDMECAAAPGVNELAPLERDDVRRELEARGLRAFDVGGLTVFVSPDLRQATSEFARGPSESAAT